MIHLKRCGHILPGGGENTHDGKLRVWHVNVPMECGYSSVSHPDNGKFVTFWIWPIFYARNHIKFQLLFHGPKWLSEVCNSSFSFPDSAKFADHTIGFVGTTPFGRLCIGTFDGQDPVPYGKSPIVQQSFTHLDWLAGFCPSRILQQSIGNLLIYLTTNRDLHIPGRGFCFLTRSRGCSKSAGWWRLTVGLVNLDILEQHWHARIEGRTVRLWVK